MTEEDKIWIDTSSFSGIQYGYPQCCIDEFIKCTPSEMSRRNPTQEEKIRLKASMINGKYTGFIPCILHAKQIISGKTTVENLINYKKRTVPLPFPHDWSLV